MTWTNAALVPGTHEWIAVKFTPKVEQRLRVELRKLAAAADARAAVLWMPDRDKGELIAFSGDFDAIPKRFVPMSSSVPSHEEFVLDDGERVHAIVDLVQLGQRMRRFRLAAIAPGPANNALLFEAIESCAAKLEQLVVAAL